MQKTKTQIQTIEDVKESFEHAFSGVDFDFISVREGPDPSRGGARFKITVHFNEEVIGDCFGSAFRKGFVISSVKPTHNGGGFTATQITFNFF